MEMLSIIGCFSLILLVSSLLTSVTLSTFTGKKLVVKLFGEEVLKSIEEEKLN